MTYDDLIDERFGKPLWWVTPERAVTPDGEFICAKRRRDADVEAHQHERAAS